MQKLGKESLDLIKEATELQATSGHEGQVRDFIKEKIQGYVDRIEYDGLGGIFGIRHHPDPDAPVIMVAAHMDEVGFMVKNITRNGLIEVVALGGWSPQVVSAQRFTLQTRKGDYPIISSSIPPHLMKDGSAKVSIESLKFDAGFSSLEEAKEFGVKPGDTIVPDVETIQTANPNRFIGKAWDNRYGVAAVIETFKALDGLDLPATLVMGANVQEEVGLRGAKGAVTKFKPDIFIAVDCSPADDLNGQEDAMGRLGDGFLLRVHDPGMITLKGMRDFFEETAEAEEIPFQYFFSKGGTDAVAAQVANEGVLAGVIGVPARYIHTHQSLFDIRDYQAALAMIKASILALDQDKIKHIYQNI